MADFGKQPPYANLQFARTNIKMKTAVSANHKTTTRAGIFYKENDNAMKRFLK